MPPEVFAPQALAQLPPQPGSTDAVGVLVAEGERPGAASTSSAQPAMSSIEQLRAQVHQLRDDVDRDLQAGYGDGIDDLELDDEWGCGVKAV